MSANPKYARIVKQSEGNMLEISLLQIDTIIANYMEKNVIPELEQNGKKVKVPLIYGNAERWKSAQRDGFLKDKEGRIQLPLIMFKRNTIAKNDSMRFLKEEVVTYPTIKKFSNKNAYDRFSLLNPDFNRRYETYDVRMPDYVNLTYEVVIWTSYTEHNNKIIEQFQYSAEQYWGDEDGYKFRVTIDNFENTQDVGAGTERIIKTTFTMAVYAYILPKRTENIPTTQKGFTIRKVVVTNEVVLNAEDSNDLTNVTTQKLIDKYGPSITGSV